MHMVGYPEVIFAAAECKKAVIFGDFHRKCDQIRTKTGKNRKKPVETKERLLTKRSERMKVKCGTVLRTRMNIGDFAYETGCGYTRFSGRPGERTTKS